MITSTASRQVKQLIQLNKKAKARTEQDVFLAEGRKMFQEAPRERIVKAYVMESQLAEYEALLQDIPYEVVADSVFRTISDTKTPQGILCVLRQYHYTLEELLQKENPHFMVLEDLQDPGNVGTIMRTAEGAGVTAVILSKNSVDIYNPKTIRSTMGSIYRVPFLYEEDLKELLSLLKEKGVTVYAAHLKGVKNYHQMNYQTGCAFLIGNEGNGLSEELAACADQYIRIPMEGQLESLNAAVASAILMYEVHRQREYLNQ